MGIMPHEVYNAPAGSRKLMYASVVLALEEEEKERKASKRKNIKAGVARRG